MNCHQIGNSQAEERTNELSETFNQNCHKSPNRA